MRSIATLLRSNPPAPPPKPENTDPILKTWKELSVVRLESVCRIHFSHLIFVLIETVIGPVKSQDYEDYQDLVVVPDYWHDRWNWWSGFSSIVV